MHKNCLKLSVIPREQRSGKLKKKKKQQPEDFVLSHAEIGLKRWHQSYFYFIVICTKMFIFTWVAENVFNFLNSMNLK